MHNTDANKMVMVPLHLPKTCSILQFEPFVQYPSTVRGQCDPLDGWLFSAVWIFFLHSGQASAHWLVQAVLGLWSIIGQSAPSFRRDRRQAVQDHWTVSFLKKHQYNVVPTGGHKDGPTVTSYLCRTNMVWRGPNKTNLDFKSRIK